MLSSVHIPYNNKLIHIKKYGEHNVLNSRRGILSLMWDKNNKLSVSPSVIFLQSCAFCSLLSVIKMIQYKENKN